MQSYPVLRGTSKLAGILVMAHPKFDPLHIAQGSEDKNLASLDEEYPIRGFKLKADNFLAIPGYQSGADKGGEECRGGIAGGRTVPGGD